LINVRVELSCLLILGLLTTAARAAVLQSDTIRLEIGDDAKLISLKASCSERELGRPGEPIAYVVVEGETVHADGATADDASIELTFGETGVAATLEWQAKGALLLVKPASVTHRRSHRAVLPAPGRRDGRGAPVLRSRACVRGRQHSPDT
jgi:hypothetical protein